MPREHTHHSHVPEERAEHFTADDGGSTEHEYLKLVAAIIGCLKPEAVLETGTWNASGTLTLARAVQKNGNGKVYGVDNDKRITAEAVDKLTEAGLIDVVELITADSLEYLNKTEQTFDLAFLDSSLLVRAQELRTLLERRLIRAGGFVLIHDASPLRIQVWGGGDPETKVFYREFEKVVADYKLPAPFLFPFSRGLLILQVPEYPEPETPAEETPKK